MSGSSTDQNGSVSEDKLYGTDQRLTEYSRGLLTKAKEYFVGHKATVGVMFIDGPVKYPAGQAKPTSRRMLKATLPRSCGSGA